MATSVVHSSICFLVIFSIVVLIPSSSGEQDPSDQYCIIPSSPPYAQYLTTDYYKITCPNVYDIVGDIVKKAIDCDPRMGASLLRLHFHDCWVNGCDGSVLMDDGPDFVSEKSADPNANSLRGFDVIAAIKSALNEKCPCGNVVSCADILAIAASESVRLLGGPCYKALLGRRDSATASEAAANANLPSPFDDVATLKKNFGNKKVGPDGFTPQELVALSGCHTIGQARCGTFISDRFTSTEPYDPTFANEMEDACDGAPSNFTVPLDNTTATFDLNYFKMLQDESGLLKSDQELYSGGDKSTSEWVDKYSGDQMTFWTDFVAAVIKMGSLPPTNDAGQIQLNGQIRCNCSIPNSDDLRIQKESKTCPMSRVTCPKRPKVVLSSLLNIGTHPTKCPTPVTYP